jgi:hypothetical protein
MTDPLDELMELKPTHASALLLDPVEVAERADRSARGARRRANGLLTGVSVAGLALAVAMGALFVRPIQAMPGGSPSPEFPYPSATPMSSFVPLSGGDDPADYSAPRLAFGMLTGTDRPDALCIYSRTRVHSCETTVAVSGLAWSQVSWRTTSSGTTSADAFVWGHFDGKKVAATAVTRLEDTSVSYSNPVPSPAPPTTALIACDRAITAATSATAAPSSAPSSQSTGSSLKDGISFPGLEAYWMDYVNMRLMVATSGSLDTAELEVPKYWDGPACIGAVPKQGPLTDLLAAAKRVREAKIDGVTSVSAADYPGGVLQVNVVANIPGLRERVVAVAGTSVSLTIVPLFVAVH